MSRMSHRVIYHPDTQTDATCSDICPLTANRIMTYNISLTFWFANAGVSVERQTMTKALGLSSLPLVLVIGVEGLTQPGLVVSCSAVKPI